MLKFSYILFLAILLGCSEALLFENEESEATEESEYLAATSSEPEVKTEPTVTADYAPTLPPTGESVKHYFGIVNPESHALLPSSVCISGSAVFRAVPFVKVIPLRQFRLPFSTMGDFSQKACSTALVTDTCSMLDICGDGESSFENRPCQPRPPKNASNLLETVQNLCKDQFNCQLNPSLLFQNYTDPCPDTPKYMIVKYICSQFTPGNVVPVEYKHEESLMKVSDKQKNQTIVVAEASNNLIGVGIKNGTEDFETDGFDENEIEDETTSTTSSMQPTTTTEEIQLPIELENTTTSAANETTEEPSLVEKTADKAKEAAAAAGEQLDEWKNKLFPSEEEAPPPEEDEDDGTNALVPCLITTFSTTMLALWHRQG